MPLSAEPPKNVSFGQIDGWPITNAGRQCSPDTTGTASVVAKTWGVV